MHAQRCGRLTPAAGHASSGHSPGRRSGCLHMERAGLIRGQAHIKSDHAWLRIRGARYRDGMLPKSSACTHACTYGIPRFQLLKQNICEALIKFYPWPWCDCGHDYLEMSEALHLWNRVRECVDAASCTFQSQQRPRQIVSRPIQIARIRCARTPTAKFITIQFDSTNADAASQAALCFPSCRSKSTQCLHCAAAAFQNETQVHTLQGIPHNYPRITYKLQCTLETAADRMHEVLMKA